jgi:outer membrane protein assembly factor BamD (BamD/ComL family)
VAAPPGAADVPSKPIPAERDLDLAAEREVLEMARRDMTERRYEDALRKIERHLREYPRGRLAPEREALAVQALVGAGRYDEARRRGADFAERFPRSIFRSVVDSTLLSIP